MITFYPRDMEIWENEFYFGPEDITLTPKPYKTYQKFVNMEELIAFLKDHGGIMKNV